MSMHISFIRNERAGRSAFTVAEMLLVLLIVSFLIIAMPPLVHKKVAKKVMRGEHGRYECWMDKDEDGNWATYEYYATEKHGAAAKYRGNILNGGHMGYKLKANERCRFKPLEMAPTAAYFVLSVTGGGGGGAYAPYDGNNSAYRDANYVDNANSSGSIAGTNYGELRQTKLGVDRLVQVQLRDELASGEEIKSSGSTKFNHEYGYGHNRSDKWRFGVGFFSNKPNYAWIYEYFPPVTNTQDVTICSGHGPRGNSYISHTSDVNTGKVLTFIEVEGGGKVPVYEYDMFYATHYGQRGGYGLCMTAPAGTLALGRSASSVYRVRPNNAINSYDWSSYINAKLVHSVKFDYDINNEDNSNTIMVKGSGGAEAATPFEGIACPYTQKIPKDRFTFVQHDGGSKTSCLNMFDYPAEQSVFKANTMTMTFGGSTSATDVSTEDVETVNPEYLDMGVSITSDFYNRNPVVEGDPSTIKTPQMVSKGMSCIIPGGKKGEGIDQHEAGYHYDIGENASTDELNGEGCVNWVNPVLNMNADQNGRKYASPENPFSYFPQYIYMKRILPLDSTTYGYAGISSKALEMTISKLSGTLEFDIGQGGEAGTFDESGSTEERRGKSGGDTIVWRKDAGMSDAVECQRNADTGVILTPGCSTVAISKGGKGYREGGMGQKIRVRGERTCTEEDEDGNFKYVVKLDGCLDSGAGPFDRRRNSMRFADNSGFYIIPELEGESTTKSAIEHEFNGRNLPGSGGDGGYSFVKKLKGKEILYALYHPNFTPESMLSIDAGNEWLQGTTYGDLNKYVLESNRNDINLSTANYRCYKKQDQIGDPIKDENKNDRNIPVTIDRPGYDTVAFCEPYEGQPGAVVIVW